MSIESKISSLITVANTKTGKTDADLTSAMQSLVDGYGGGGAPIYRTTEGMAYTPHEVWTAITAPASGFRDNMFAEQPSWLILNGTLPVILAINGCLMDALNW